jgi:hypothetical protein
LEHKLLIPWNHVAGAGLALCSRRGKLMTRKDWQALLFGLILLALCFVQ